LVVKIKINR